MTTPRLHLGVRGDLRADGDRCDRCGRPLAGAYLRRIVVEEAVDVLALCRCGEPTIIRYSSEAA